MGMQINHVHILYARWVIDAINMSKTQLCAPSAHPDVYNRLKKTDDVPLSWRIARAVFVMSVLSNKNTRSGSITKPNSHIRLVLESENISLTDRIRGMKDKKGGGE